jgi:hypothetical protein
MPPMSRVQATDGASVSAAVGCSDWVVVIVSSCAGWLD